MPYQTYEDAVVADFLEVLLARVTHDSIRRVKSITVRRGAGLPEAHLRKILDRKAIGTPLQGSELIFEELIFHFTCKTCGMSHIVTADDLFGTLFICPQCGWSHEVKEARRLELVEITPYRFIDHDSAH